LDVSGFVYCLGGTTTSGSLKDEKIFTFGAELFEFLVGFKVFEQGLIMYQ
jgi:hypothetical protein